MRSSGAAGSMQKTNSRMMSDSRNSSQTTGVRIHCQAIPKARVDW
jgi:hypothetical protein